jgi:hypothetical protein
MKKLLASAAIVGMTFASFGAIAQDRTDATVGDLMEQFHTDNTMTEMRTLDENRVTFQGLPEEQQASLLAECEREAEVMADGSSELSDAASPGGALTPAIAAFCEQSAQF